MTRVVLANGVFDLLHYGHLRHLKAARAMGDRLIVSVTRDAYVNKGPGRPVFNEKQRASMVMALRCVDDVIMVNNSSDAIALLKPFIFVKGKEYEDKISIEEQNYCVKHNILIRFTDEPVFSSTELLHHYDRLRQD